MRREKWDSAREERRREAEARKRERDQLTPEEQIARLDERLGVGVGAKRERARLQKLIDAKE